MPVRPDLQLRHRRRQDATRARILGAARELVEEYPWRAVSIDVVARRAGLTRSAFTEHFADRRELLLALLEEVGAHLQLLALPWMTSSAADGPAALRRVLADLAAAYVADGRLMRALADEATQDADLGRLYASLGAQIADDVAVRIRRDITAGRSAVADPAAVATALVWLNERFLIRRFGHRPLGDPAEAAAALAEIWLGALYGTARGSGSVGP